MIKILVNNTKKNRDFLVQHFYLELKAVLGRKPKATKTEIGILLNCFEFENFDFIKHTDLYIKHGGEYCKLLTIINMYNTNE